LVTVLFLLTIQPAFATGNKRKIDDYSIEELLNLSVQEQENLGFYVLAEVPMRIPVSNTDGSRVVSYVDGKITGTFLKSNDSEEIEEGQWTFDRQYYIIHNQSVGDDNWNTPMLNAVYETEIDWIKVYQ
jgi:hypothetical protein